jgi:hypothetical protein
MQMKKANKILLLFLIFDLPVQVIFIIGGLLKASGGAFWNSGFANLLWEILVWNLFLWFFVLLFILAELLISETFRSDLFSVAAKLAGIKERDERESMAVDKAGRYAFISTFALLVVLLFVFSLQVNIGNLPPDMAVPGKSKYVTIGFGFSAADNMQKAGAAETGDIFSTSGLNISKQGLIALVACWHLLGFFVYLRRKNKYVEK